MPCLYHIYPDPYKSGNTEGKVTLNSHTENMPNNGWFIFSIDLLHDDVGVDALNSESSNYFFRIEVEFETIG